MAREESKVRGITLLTLDEHWNDAKTNGTVLRLVQWVYEDKKGAEQSSVLLEKRSLWLNEEKELRSGKAKGLNRFDIQKIIDNIDEIKRLQKNPPAVPPEDTRPTQEKLKQEESGGDEDLEEVPF